MACLTDMSGYIEHESPLSLLGHTILIVGAAYSGKTTLAKHLVDKLEIYGTVGGFYWGDISDEQKKTILGQLKAYRQGRDVRPLHQLVSAAKREGIKPEIRRELEQFDEYVMGEVHLRAALRGHARDVSWHTFVFDQCSKKTFEDGGDLSLQQMFLNGRRHYVTTIIVVQSPADVPKWIRNNATCIYMSEPDRGWAPPGLLEDTFMEKYRGLLVTRTPTSRYWSIRANALDLRTIVADLLA